MSFKILTPALALAVMLACSSETPQAAGELGQEQKAEEPTVGSDPSSSPDAGDGVGSCTGMDPQTCPSTPIEVGVMGGVCTLPQAAPGVLRFEVLTWTGACEPKTPPTCAVTREGNTLHVTGEQKSCWGQCNAGRCGGIAIRQYATCETPALEPGSYEIDLGPAALGRVPLVVEADGTRANCALYTDQRPPAWRSSYPNHCQHDDECAVSKAGACLGEPYGARVDQVPQLEADAARNASGCVAPDPGGDWGPRVARCVSNVCVAVYESQ